MQNISAKLTLDNAYDPLLLEFVFEVIFDKIGVVTTFSYNVAGDFDGLMWFGGYYQQYGFVITLNIWSGVLMIKKNKFTNIKLYFRLVCREIVMSNEISF